MQRSILWTNNVISNKEFIALNRIGGATLSETYTLTVGKCSIGHMGARTPLAQRKKRDIVRTQSQSHTY